jgi:hypothetical protein
MFVVTNISVSPADRSFGKPGRLKRQNRQVNGEESASGGIREAGARLLIGGRVTSLENLSRLFSE